MQLDLEPRNRLRQTGKRHLHPGALRPGLTGGDPLAQPQTAEP